MVTALTIICLKLRRIKLSAAEEGVWLFSAIVIDVFGAIGLMLWLTA